VRAQTAAWTRSRRSRRPCGGDCGAPARAHRRRTRRQGRPGIWGANKALRQEGGTLAESSHDAHPLSRSRSRSRSR